MSRGNVPNGKTGEIQNGFHNFSEARFTTDTIFQQSSRRGEDISEIIKYFSEKHYLYGYKTEVPVPPNRIATGCSCSYPVLEAKNSIVFEKVVLPSKCY